jgi:hypothetical protein
MKLRIPTEVSLDTAPFTAQILKSSVVEPGEGSPRPSLAKLPSFVEGLARIIIAITRRGLSSSSYDSHDLYHLSALSTDYCFGGYPPVFHLVGYCLPCNKSRATRSNCGKYGCFGRLCRGSELVLVSYSDFNLKNDSLFTVYHFALSHLPYVHRPLAVSASIRRL